MEGEKDRREGMKPRIKFFGVIGSNEFSYGILGRAWTLAIRPSGRRRVRMVIVRKRSRWKMRRLRGERKRMGKGDNEKKGERKREGEKIFDINNASREDVSRVTYHYRVFGIQIPGSKNPLLILYSEYAFNIHIGEGVIYLQIYRARARDYRVTMLIRRVCRPN